MVLAGSPHWSSLPGQNPTEQPHTGKGDKCHLQVGDRYSGEEKASHHTCWCAAFYGTACHILLLVYEHPHHINETRYVYFTVSHKNNPLAKICTHPLKSIAKYLWFPSEGFLWKSNFWHSLFHWYKHVNSENVKKFIDFNSWDGKNT